MKVMPPISLTMVFWGLNGFARWAYEKRHPFLKLLNNLNYSQYAVIVPAHNEERSIQQTLDSLIQNIPAQQIFVVSDGSSDQTAEIVRKSNCNVLELNPGQGKARALEILLEHFEIYDRFKYVLIADADTIFPENYARKVLSILENNPDYAAVTSYGASSLPQLKEPSWKMFFYTYRIRLWKILQFFVSFGETSKWLNMYPVIPGYASTYRTEVLRQLKISVPGLAIEDFNLAFQMHKKKLGKIGFHPEVFAMSQDPDNWPDFWRQISRWNLGFWQTIFYWKVWPSWFWMFLGIYLVESIFITLFALSLPGLLAWMFFISWPGGVNWSDPIGLTVLEIFVFGFVMFNLIDYTFSWIIGWKYRLPWIAWYAMAFWLIRYAEAVNLALMIPKALVTKSNGKWVSPVRWSQANEAS